MDAMRRRPALVVALLAAAAVAGCGGSSSSSATGSDSADLPTASSSGAGQGPTLTPAARQAESVRAADFPPARGRTLQQVANTLTPGPQFAAANKVFTPGVRRLGFGLIDRAGKPFYGPTAVYVAKGPGQPAEGPYPAPTDPLVVEAKYRSKTTDASDIAAVYAARVPFKSAGPYAVLAVTKTPKGLVGAPGRVKVASSSGIPDVGDPAPRVHTPTVQSAGGDLSAIDTRLPHDDMHRIDLAGVAGRKPVALIISTPALCQSRVCGPVTDVVAQLEPRYRKRMAFIHQEVYNGNQISRGLRPQLKAFNLQTEPWFFVLDRHGRVAARLEGAFGLHEAEQAIKAGLKE
jgi:hypothetical protein